MTFQGCRSKAAHEGFHGSMSCPRLGALTWSVWHIWSGISPCVVLKLRVSRGAVVACSCGFSMNCLLSWTRKAKFRFAHWFLSFLVHFFTGCLTGLSTHVGPNLPLFFRANAGSSRCPRQQLASHLSPPSARKTGPGGHLYEELYCRRLLHGMVGLAGHIHNPWAAVQEAQAARADAAGFLLEASALR